MICLFNGGALEGSMVLGQRSQRDSQLPSCRSYVSPSCLALVLDTDKLRNCTCPLPLGKLENT